MDWSSRPTQDAALPGPTQHLQASVSPLNGMTDGCLFRAEVLIWILWSWVGEVILLSLCLGEIYQTFSLWNRHNGITGGFSIACLWQGRQFQPQILCYSLFCFFFLQRSQSIVSALHWSTISDQTCLYMLLFNVSKGHTAWLKYIS